MFIRRVGFFLLAGLLAMPAIAEQKCDQGLTATAPAKQFEFKGDGLVVDTKNKNTWLRCALGMTWDGSSCEGKTEIFKWSAVEDAIKELNKNRVGGHSDWRLPTVDELNTLIEKQCFKPAINLTVFPFSPESGFWTSTDEEGLNPRGWIVHFLHGQAYVVNRNQAWRVRPIAGK